MDKYLGILENRIEEYLERKDPEIIKYIATCYYPYVCKTANNFKQNKEKTEELIQVGMVAVLEGIESYHSKECNSTFTRYIQRKVTSRMMRYLRTTYNFTDYPKIEEVIETLMQESGHLPSPAKTVTYLYPNEELLYRTAQASPAFYFLSTDRMVEEEACRHVVFEEVMEMMENYDEPTKYLIYSYFGVNGYEKKSMEQLEEELSISKGKMHHLMSHVFSDIRSSYLNSRESSGRK